MALPDGRVLVALADAALDPDPTWTALDQEYPSLVSSYSIDRGRQYELDRTDTGRATVEIADRDGILDPTSVTSPFYPNIGPLRQVMLRRYNPVADQWETRFRGFIDELDYAIDPSQRVSRLTMSLVDIFEILSAVNMYPDTFGHNAAAVSVELARDVDGQVWFGPDLNGQTMEDRIVAILTFAGIPDEFYVVFSGNVTVQPTSYSPGESAMSALLETVDAEWPGVANVVCDRHGRLCARGRVARFDPAGVVASLSDPTRWDFHQWKAGDGGYVASSPGTYAHIRDFGFNRGLSKIINHALATPANILDSQVTGQIYKDPTSIGIYGYRSWQAESLLTFGGLPTETLPATSALEETRKFAQFYVSNFKQPQNRVTAITFRSIRPDASGASESWRLICQADVSDTIEVNIDVPSSGGFVGADYFIEGVHEQSSPLTGLYDDVTMSLDLSPRSYFESDPWAPP